VAAARRPTAGPHPRRANPKPQCRGAAFGPEVEVLPTAPAYDRVLGFFVAGPTCSR
jgi:hypothetical protein